MNTKEKKKNDKMGGFAFLGNKWLLFMGIAILVWLCAGFEMYFNFKLSEIEKRVQGGMVIENWSKYLTLLLVCVIFVLFTTIIKVLSDMWIEKTTKFKFFCRYKYIIQSHKESCMLQYYMAVAKLTAITGIGISIIKCIFTIKIMDIVEMTFAQYVGAISILITGIVLGIFRGKLQKMSDEIGNTAKIVEQMLTEHYVVSTNVLKNHLTELDKKYSKRIRIQVLKNAITEFPKLVRVTIFLMLMYSIVDSMKEGEIYAYTYVIWKAYGYLLELSMNIGYVIEDCAKIWSYIKDPKLKSLNQFEAAEGEIIEKEAENFNLGKAFFIKETFTASVSRADGTEGKYSIVSDLKINPGEIILLEGENGTEKSRFLGIVKEIFSESCCISYDVNTAIAVKYADNFSKPVKFDVLKRIANGLEIVRIPDTEEEFYNFELEKAINGADVQKLIALQILYLAETENKEQPKLIILDEILGNVSEENAPKVMEYISQELKKIEAFTIIVSHAHKDVVCKYVDYIWQMTNDGDKIKVKAEKNKL